MQKTVIIIALALSVQSCGSDTFTCACKKGNTEVASYQLEMDKKAAGFDCTQKELQFTGKPEFENVKCTIQ